MTPQIERTTGALRLAWSNGSSVSFGLEDGGVLGIREVEVAGVPLRNPDRLWKPLVATPTGIRYQRFRLLEAEPTTRGGMRVRTEASGLDTRLLEELDEYLCDVIALSDDASPRDIFEWELWPSELELDGRHFCGFAYRYRFQSREGREIYRVFDDATWEIGGAVEGNTLLLQGQLNPPVTRLKKDAYFTTACNYYGAEMRGVLDEPERISIQRLPRIATLQAFDFLAHERGLLFNFFDPTSEVLTLVQKARGEDRLHFLDELRRPLASEFVSHPKHILFCATDERLVREDVRNIWRSAYDFVHERERRRAGIEASPVLPRVWTPQFSDEEVRIGAERFPRSQMLYHLADRVLPQWAQMGAREICTPSLWVSDYTVDRFRTKNESGLQGGFTVSGICCVRVHEIDELWGGTRALKYFVDKAHELGMQVQLWWATHLSRRAPIFEEHPEWMIRSRDNQAGCGGIGKDVIIPMDLNNPECFEWEYSKLKSVYEATGIDGFFHDSYGNYTFLPVNYGDPQMRGQQEACERLVARLQKLGMKTFTAEGIGPFGTGHFGMHLWEGDESENYQNALEWWLGEEDMTYRLNMGIGAPLWPGREAEARDFAFRCMACGGRFGFSQQHDGVEQWSGWWREQNRLLARLAPLTGKRTLLPDGQGVLWERAADKLLFALEDFAYELATEQEVWEVTADGENHVVPERRRLQAAKQRVYRIA
jgi:hypothetical protein